VICLVVQPTKGALDQPGQILRSAIDSLVKGLCLVSDSHGLASFEASFQHATFFVLAALIAVFVAQVDLHSCEVVAISSQGICHYATDLSCQRLVAFDVMVGINLNLHGALPL
jgi:hypothetical protein